MTLFTRPYTCGTPPTAPRPRIRPLAVPTVPQPPTRPRAPPFPEYYCPHTPTPEPHGRSQNPPTTVGTVGTPTGHPAGESGGDTRRAREGAQETYPQRHLTQAIEPARRLSKGQSITPMSRNALATIHTWSRAEGRCSSSAA
jgi:hypothetical protein